MLKIILWTVGFLLIGYVVLCGFLYWQQEQFFFYPTRLGPEYVYTFTTPFEETDIPVDGATINVVRFRAENPKGVLLYLHGNGDVVTRLEPIAGYFVSLGYDVVIPDYRSYGKSSGVIKNEAELHADMAAVYKHLIRTDPEGSVTIYAQSLGTGLAVQLAAANEPKRLILESPYFSLVNLVRSHMPFVPGFLVKYQLRSDQYVNRINAPIYVIHGDQDTVIPFEQGERLYSLIEGEKEFLHMPGAGHGPLLGDERLRAFLERILL